MRLYGVLIVKAWKRSGLVDGIVSDGAKQRN